MKTIRALRRARGWTQFELALRVGVQPQAVYLWESGRRTPQVAQMRRLGELFGLCSDEIDLDLDSAPGAAGADAAGAGAAGGERGRHRPRAERHPGEPVPGRTRQGRAKVRGGGPPPADPDDA